jgi:AcrR family transcriptional regulator
VGNLSASSSFAVPSIDVGRQLTRRGEERRRALLDDALRQFAERGYHATSVSDICESVGVGKGAFYWYFESKEQLFLEALAEAQAALQQSQQEAAAEEPDPVRRLEAGIRGSLEWLEAHRDVLAVFQLAATDSRFLEALRAGEARMADQLAEHLKDAIVAGAIPDGDPRVLAYAVVGAVEALAHTFLLRPGAWDQGIADTAVAFCLGGILSPRRGGSASS